MEFNKIQKDDIFRIYVTDCMKTIAENIARIGGGGSMKSRYYDIINPVRKNVTTETADEIIKRMKMKMKAMGGVTD